MKTTILKIAVLLMVLAGCKEKIEIDLEQSEPRIVIEGSVTNELKKHIVKVSRTTAYFNSRPSLVSGAFVSISNGEELYMLNETEPGVYVAEEAFAGSPGNTYTLNVVVGGQKYSATSKMVAVPEVDSIKLEKGTNPLSPGVILDPDKTYYNILLYCQEPGNIKNYYLMDAFINGIIATDTVTKKGISDDMMFNGMYVTGTKTLQVAANIGDTITFSLESIDMDYYMFILGIHDALMNGSPFAGTPANVKGNISNGAFGYFYAACISNASCVVK